MTTRARRAPSLARHKSWDRDKVSSGQMFGFLKFLSIGCALFYAAAWLVI